MTRRFVAVVTLLLVVLTGGLVWQRATSPSDGAIVQLSNRPWQADRLKINHVLDRTTGLRHGDVVLSVNGRDLLSQDEGAQPGLGDVVHYTVERDGQIRRVVLPLQAFPLAAFLGDSIGPALFVFVLLLVAAFVFLQRPDDAAVQALLMCASLTFCGTTAWLLGGDATALAWGTPGMLQVAGEVALALAWAPLLHFVLIPPGSTLHPPRAVVMSLYLLPPVLYAAYVAVAVPTARTTQEAGTRVSQVSLAPSTALPLFSVILAVFGYRAIRDPGARRRARWVFLPLLFAVAAWVLVWTILPILLGSSAPPEDLVVLLFLPCVFAFGAAALRYSWFDVQLVVRRSMVFGGLTLCLLLVFLGITWLVIPVFGSGRPSLVALVASIGVALSALPLRAWLQRRLGHLVFGSRDDPYEVMGRLGRIDAAAGPQGVLDQLAETLLVTLRLQFAAIELGQVRAARGVACGNATRYEITYGHEVLGHLALETRVHRESLGPADRQLMAAVLQQVGSAASTILLSTQLQASRERLVLAREEERRRLHHRLHDGLGAGLAAHTMQMEVALALVRSDQPARAAAALSDLLETSRELRADVHRLVYDLRPPTLDRLGLPAAIRERSPKAWPLVVQARGDLTSLPAAVEIAAFWVTVEAANNAARHADATSCTIRLVRDDEALHVEVEDDGVGLPISYLAGGGFLSMRERVEELGGRWSVESRPGGGALVRAVLPLRVDAEAAEPPGIDGTLVTPVRAPTPRGLSPS